MMPYEAYQLYQIERPKSAAEVRLADAQAGQVAAAVSGMFRQLNARLRRRTTATGQRSLELRPFWE